MPAKKTPDYLKTHKLRGKQLKFSLKAEAEALIEKARRASSGRAGKTLVKEGKLRLTLVGLRKGAEIKKHGVEGPASIHVLRGAVDFHGAGGTAEVPAGGVVVFDSGVEHDTRARRDSAFLITMSYKGG